MEITSSSRCTQECKQTEIYKWNEKNKKILKFGDVCEIKMNTSLEIVGNCFIFVWIFSRIQK